MTEETVLNESNSAGLEAFEMPLFQAMRRLQQDAEVHAKRLARYGGLSPVQLMILQLLASEGQLTASDLSRRVSLTAATLSGQIDRLEERGLLQRQRDDQQRRQRQALSGPLGAGPVAAPAPSKREADKVGRNDPCPCGSGKKYKKCCGQ